MRKSNLCSVNTQEFLKEQLNLVLEDIIGDLKQIISFLLAEENA